MSFSLVIRLLPHVLRPSVALDLVTMLWAFRERGRLWPRLSKPYLQWRLQTYFGDASHTPTAREILAFARWRRRMARRSQRRS